MLENRKVRVIFMKKVYFTNPYVIPIIKNSSGWQTGQKLSESKMINLQPLTKEEQEMYPFIVDPTNHYKVAHLQWLDLSSPYAQAMYTLLTLCGDWALSKNEYENDKGKFVGYLEDKKLQAQAGNKFRDERYEAEMLVRQSPIADYKRISMMLNSLVKDFNANVESMSEDEIKERILEVVDTEPSKVKLCFEKYNPGVEFEYFILECLHYNVLSKKNNGDIFDGSEFIGSTVHDVRKYIERKENEYRRTKWGKLLNERKGIKSMIFKEDKENQEAEMINAVKLAIFDNNIERALTNVDVLRRYYPNCKDLQALENHVAQLTPATKTEPVDVETEAPDTKITGATEQTRTVDNQELAIAKFRSEQSQRELVDIQNTIKHVASKYKQEDVTSIWKDKAALIEYMVKTKFNLI